MTDKEKKEAWQDLRKIMPVLERMKSVGVHNGGHKVAFFVTMRRLYFQMEHRIIFTRMRQAARDKKGVRQAYRYGIAAGLFHGGMPQLSGKVFYRGTGCCADLWPGDEEHKEMIAARLKAKHEYLNDPRRFAWMG